MTISKFVDYTSCFPNALEMQSSYVNINPKFNQSIPQILLFCHSNLHLFMKYYGISISSPQSAPRHREAQQNKRFDNIQTNPDIEINISWDTYLSEENILSLKSLYASDIDLYESLIGDPCRVLDYKNKFYI